MLLVNGKQFEIPREEAERYSRDIIYHVPQDVVKRDDRNNRLAIPASWGVENSYRMYDPKTKKYDSVVYYESSFFDESRKRDVYAPSHLVIGPTGFIKILSTDAERNWFYMNHPANQQNALRKLSPNPYSKIKAQFWTHDPNEKAQRRAERTKYLYQILNHVQADLPASWKWGELQNACEVINQEAGVKPLPYDLINYKDFKEEEHEVLRVAISDLAYEDPLWVYSKLISGRHTRIAEVIKLAKNTDLTGFGYDVKASHYFYKMEDDKRGIFVTVPGKKDPDKFLFEACLSHPDMFNKLVAIVEESKQKQLA